MSYSPQGVGPAAAVSIASGTSFPPAPSAGDCFYRTDLRELFVYNGAEWVSWDVSPASYIVYTDGTAIYAKNGRTGNIDFSGADAAAVINQAIAALGATGGTVALLEGQYDIASPINLASNVSLVGQGAGTVLRIPDGHNADLRVISASNASRVRVANLRIDGNKANQTVGNMSGICLTNVTDSRIEGCVVENLFTDWTAPDYPWAEGIYLGSSNYNTVTGNTCRGNGCDGIHLASSSNNNIARNALLSNGNNGISISNSSNYNIVVGNIARDTEGAGIYVDHSSNNTIASNMVLGNSQMEDNEIDGIMLNLEADYNNVQGNIVRHLGGEKQHRYGIYIGASSCDGNLIINNDL